MKRILICLPLCLGLVAMPALSLSGVPLDPAMTCAAEPAADVSMMTRHAAAKSAAEAAIAGQAPSPCRDGKTAAPDHRASHAGHRAHRGHPGPAVHRHATRGMCAASLPASALIALPELVLAHRGPGSPHAPLAELAESASTSVPAAVSAHC